MPPALELPLPPHRSPRPPAEPNRAPEQLNTAEPGAAEAAFLTCCGSHLWARRLVDHRPYPDLDALLAASDEAAYDLPPGDLAEALACEPLRPVIPGQRPGQGTYTAADTALRAAHAAYESRFGHVFVICLDDVPPSQALNHLLAGIRARLANDPEEERVLAAEELRKLARGRLTRLVHEPNSPYVPV
ncbi:2-oxo-4-hydroxy-4-carboxy-5-ureidoimidazoline decarboxylase [Streptomyces sp. NPDC057302]|uniref:2-oxo-4-hydroxy-4-carboxy-5-ureidoimidazoline decarboxylase n=1 Tax=Streptomyces sp. NPDC057302 TaxID=3346094 RepID=UPI00362F10CC